MTPRLMYVLLITYYLTYITYCLTYNTYCLIYIIYYLAAFKIYSYLIVDLGLGHHRH